MLNDISLFVFVESESVSVAVLTFALISERNAVEVSAKFVMVAKFETFGIKPRSTFAVSEISCRTCVSESDIRVST